jgi:hypothetical protein
MRGDGQDWWAAAAANSRRPMVRCYFLVRRGGRGVVLPRGYQETTGQLRTASSTNGLRVGPEFAGVIADVIHGRPVTRSMMRNAV